MRHDRAIKIIKERGKVKKSILILGFALLLVFAFAASAMAATMDLIPDSTIKDGTSDYSSPATPILPTGYTAGTSRIHSHYQQNTNACASCHAVHTAVGEMLLQWESDQAACEACHNGTLGDATYNVFAGTIGTGMQTWGGAFNQSAASGSMHNVGTGQTIGAAPGGDGSNASNPATKWGKEFTCTSCHDPHGTAGNGRILNPTVNNANYSTGYASSNEFASKAKKLFQIDPTNNVWVARNPVVIGAQGTYDSALGDPDQKPGEYARLIIGHGVNLNVYHTDGTKLTKDTDYTVDNSGEYTKITFINDPGETPKATYTAALRVVMKVENYLQDKEKVTYVKGMNDFCGACHTDYNTGNFNKLQAENTSGVALTYQGSPYYVKTKKTDGNGNSLSTYNVLNGFYHEAYRHAVGRFSGSAANETNGLAFEKIRLEANGVP